MNRRHNYEQKSLTNFNLGYQKILRSRVKADYDMNEPAASRNILKGNTAYDLRLENLKDSFTDLKEISSQNLILIKKVMISKIPMLVCGESLD